MGLLGQVDNIVEYWGRKRYWSHGYQDARMLIRDTAIFERCVSHMSLNCLHKISQYILYLPSNSSTTSHMYW